MKSANKLSENQANFKDDTGIAGWYISSGSGLLKRIEGSGPYARYVPEGLDYLASDVGNVLAGISNSTDPLQISSGFIPVDPENIYLTSVMSCILAADTRSISIQVDYYRSESDSSLLPNTEFNAPITLSDQSVNSFILQLNSGISPELAYYAKIKITLSGTTISDPIEVGDSLLLYDPVMHDFSNIPSFALDFYNTLPEFMRRDDENLPDIVSEYQPLLPLRSFVDTLSARASMIADKATDFDYVRETYGDYSESALTDPLTTDAINLIWLATITGTRLLSQASGFSPWAALETYDGDGDGTPSEFGDDLGLLQDWLALETLDPDFFDTVQSYREQIRTGFSGLAAGTKQAIETFIRTQLLAEDPENRSLVFMSNRRDNPHASLLLVDPGADPDPAGTLLSNAVNAVGVAGVDTESTNIAEQSGRSYYNMDELLGTTTVTEDPVGSATYGAGFIVDSSGHGQNIILNSTGDPHAPELGGGVGAAHFEEGSAFYSGVDSYVTAGNSGDLDVAALSSFDFILEVSHLHEDLADASPGSLVTTSTADWWKWRNKRLLACGNNNGENTNDWALYVVSGSTVDDDPYSRLMYMEGYRNPTSTNYIVSDPVNIKGDTSSGSSFIRVAKKDDGTIKLFFQKSLHGNWEANEYASGTITSTITSSSTSANCYIQLFGDISVGTAGDASAISGELHRAMFFNSYNASLSPSDTESEAVAYVNNTAVLNYAEYTYSPTFDIDFSNYANYAESGTAGTLTVTVNTTASNDNDIKVFRTNSTSGNLWHFGSAASGQGDTLSVTGLDSGTNYYTFMHEVNEDGTITTIDITSGTPVTGVTQIDFSADDYGGKDIYSVEVCDADTNGGGTSPGSDAVAYYTTSTLSAGASAGTDALSASWELNRSWPADSYFYVPSQVIDRSYFSTYEGTLDVKKKLHLENYSSVSVSGAFRRHWTDASTEYNIYKVVNSSGQGLQLKYSGTKFVATYSDGTLTETVEWTESPVYGSWHVYAVRRSAQSGLELWVDGTLVDSADAEDLEVFGSVTRTAEIGEGNSNTFNPRVEVASLTIYDRYLSNPEIALLNSELSI